MKITSLKDLPDLNVVSRKQIWRTTERARLRLHQAQRKCFIDDEFHSDSGGRRIDTDSASTASIEYAEAYFEAISIMYLRLRRPYRRLRHLLTTAMTFVCSETEARWKGLGFDDRMSFESSCLPKVKSALLDRKDELLTESLDPLKSKESPGPKQPSSAANDRSSNPSHAGLVGEIDYSRLGSNRAQKLPTENALADSVDSEPTPTEQTTISDIKSFERWIQPLKVRLKRELISPEDTLKELRRIADGEQYPVRLRACILELLDALRYPAPEDSGAHGLRSALRQKSEALRREAVGIILERIMDPPEVRDYRASKRHSERTKAIRGDSTEFPMTQPTSTTLGRSEPGVFVSSQPALAAARQAVVMPILAAKEWTRGALVTKAGVGKNCVYEYLAGKRRLSPPNRKALAEELGLKPEELPE